MRHLDNLVYKENIILNNRIGNNIKKILAMIQIIVTIEEDKEMETEEA